MWIWSTVDLDLCSKSLEFLDLCSKPTAGLSTDLDASGVENGWIWWISRTHIGSLVLECRVPGLWVTTRPWFVCEGRRLPSNLSHNLLHTLPHICLFLSLSVSLSFILTDALWRMKNRARTQTHTRKHARTLSLQPSLSRSVSTRGLYSRTLRTTVCK